MPCLALILLSWPKNLTIGLREHHWWNVVTVRIGLDDLLLFISNLQIFRDEPWFARAYSDVYTKIRNVKTNDKLRGQACFAASLSNLSRINGADAETIAVTTHLLYEALSGGDRAESIVTRCVSDLSQLVEVGSSTGEAENPKPNNFAAAGRKRKKT